MLRTTRTAALALCLGLAATGMAQLRSEIFVQGLARPVAMVPHPSQPSLFYVVEQRTGRVRIVQNGVVQPGELFNALSRISIGGGEQGLLGIAFHPNFSLNRFFYLSYTDTAGRSVIERFTMAADNLSTVPNSAQLVMRFDQPYNNHNGGTIQFGPDNMLYFGMGDGGSGNDPQNYAQNLNSLLGKMLRIDVNGDDFPLDPVQNYAIPSGNPHIGIVGRRAEIWASGLRNPWKWSFDARNLLGTGGIWTGDVGQSAREELNYEPRNRPGRDYGWRVFEGTLATGLGGGNSLAKTGPVYEYAHAEGRSITGGFVYRGMLLGDYFGRYFFGDFVSNRVWSIQPVYGTDGEASTTNLEEHTDELFPSGISGVSGFAQDRDGELYVLDYFGGRVHRILPRDRVWIAQVTSDYGAPFGPNIRALNAADSSSLSVTPTDAVDLPLDYLTTLNIRHQTNASTAAFFDLEVDVRTSDLAGLGRMRIQMRDFVQNRQVTLATVDIFPTMTTYRIDDLPAATYRDASGRIDVRLSAWNTTPPANDPWLVNYGRVKLIPRP